MKTEKLNYHLPPELVAQRPVKVRSNSRLLVLNRSKGELADSCFNQIGEYLLPGDCVVLNDTKVLPARFFARRCSGGKLGGLFLAEKTAGTWEVMLKGAHRVKVGETIYLEDGKKDDFCQAVLVAKIGQGKCILKLQTDADFKSILDKIGFPPLPPFLILPILISLIPSCFWAYFSGMSSTLGFSLKYGADSPERAPVLSSMSSFISDMGVISSAWGKPRVAARLASGSASIAITE